MASLAAGIIDPTKAGKYRVVLSDALLGKEPKEVYTGIRYNHRPSLSSSTAPHQARITPASSSGDTSSYDLSFQDNGGRYTYNGTRGHEQGQYVLIFDPEREVFVLDRVDSMFNMNLVRTPTNNDAESLRDDYQQLEAHRPSGPGRPANNKGKSAKAKKPAAKEAAGPSASKKAEPPRSQQPAKSRATHNDSEDESSDDDLLTIEDPGGGAPSTHRDFSPGFIDKPRRFSEFVQEQNEEEEDDDGGIDDVEVEVLNDADGEEEEEEEEEEEDDDDDEDEAEHFKLPSPITRQMMGQNVNVGGSNGVTAPTHSAHQDVEEVISDEDEDMEDVGTGGASLTQEGAALDDNDVDLEAALMAEMAELSEPQPELESDVSEEE
ncbi:RNA polymerase II transcription elongation factor-domain-containing protein [Xylariaceae sp. FL0594]|nr:RNA polymerase II transcription elongation factor-domain-containing protein [Xylariaceae sp. FL0594]